MGEVGGGGIKYRASRDRCTSHKLFQGSEFHPPPPNSSSSPLKAKQSGFAGNREKLSVSLRLKRQNSQTLLATQEGEEQAGRGGASRLVKKQRSIPDMPPEERRA